MKTERWHSLLVCVSLLNIITVSALELEDGDNCTIASGMRGFCTNIKKCPYALSLLDLRQKPEICGFEGHTPIVCCPGIERPSTEIRQELNNKSEPIKEMPRISEKMCRRFYPPVYAILVPGGEPAFVAEFKHMALIGFGEEGDIEWLCGGSLVSLQFVMTAAHCLFSPQFGAPKWVRLGDLDISTNDDGTEPQQIRIKRNIIHPEYRSPSKNHDIALLELETPASWSKFVAPACLDTRRYHDEKQMIATGWGKTRFTGSSSNHLLKTDLDVVPFDQCQEFYNNIDRSQLPNGIDDELHICAGGGPTRDTCQGDSGGPLQVIRSNPTVSKVYVIVGITSFGKACGISNSPSIYTRVYSHLTWLEQNIWPSED